MSPSFVTHDQLQQELKATEDRIYQAMAEEFSEIADRMATKADLANFATKDDLAEVKSDLAVVKSDLAVVKSDLTEVKGDLASVKHEVGDIKGILVDVLTQLQAIRDDNAIAIHQCQRTNDMVEKHEKRIHKLEKNCTAVSL